MMNTTSSRFWNRVIGETTDLTDQQRIFTDWSLLISLDSLNPWFLLTISEAMLSCFYAGLSTLMSV